MTIRTVPCTPTCTKTKAVSTQYNGKCIMDGSTPDGVYTYKESAMKLIVLGEGEKRVVLKLSQDGVLYPRSALANYMYTLCTKAVITMEVDLNV